MFFAWEGSVDAAIVLTVIAFVFLPQAVALVAIPWNGRGWARTRVISYTTCAVLYGLNGLLAVVNATAANGQRAGGTLAVSGFLAFGAWKAAHRARQAWRAHDFRPQWMRNRDGMLPQHPEPHVAQPAG